MWETVCEYGCLASAKDSSWEKWMKMPQPMEKDSESDDDIDLDAEKIYFSHSDEAKVRTFLRKN